MKKGRKNEIKWHSGAALHQNVPFQMTWQEDPPLWLRPAYCFASVIAWTLYLFYFDSKTNNQGRWLPVFWGRRLKRSSTFLRKRVRPIENPGYAPDSGWPRLRIFWPRNDLAPLLHWRCHWMDIWQPQYLGPRFLQPLSTALPWLHPRCKQVYGCGDFNRSLCTRRQSVWSQLSAVSLV